MSVCLHVYMYTTFMSGAHIRQKRVSNPLELELWMVINHPVGSKYQTQALCKSNMFLTAEPSL